MTSVTGKNFSGEPTPSIVVGEYVKCNFSQPALVDVAGKKRGTRLFPGDDKPRIFRECNLSNAEPPPGSTVDDCYTKISEIIKSSSDTVTIDGVAVTMDHHIVRLYGEFDGSPGDYVYLPSPLDTQVD